MQTTDVPFHADVRPLTGSVPGWVVTLSGEVDSSTSPILQAKAEELISTTNEGVLLLMDLSRVEFVDSSGLRVIVSLGNELESRGGRLELSGLSAAARRILELTGLIDRYRSDESAADAYAAGAAPAQDARGGAAGLGGDPADLR
jgi:anti-sigma B factor antagonist